MADKNFNLEVVTSEESVARIIFSPSYIYNGRVSPTAFRWDILPSGDAEDYISVLRESEVDLKEQTANFRPRIEGDSRYGYALLKVADIRDIGNSELLDDDVVVDVLPYPTKRHKNHAGIRVVIDNKVVTALTPVCADIIVVQKELAMRCGDIVKF